jgi:hypothetical protein
VYCIEDAVLEFVACTLLSQRSEDSQMLRRLSTLVLAFMLVALANSAAQAQYGRDTHADHGKNGRGAYGGQWTLLGQRHIDGRADNDKIDIGRDNGRFRAIQFRVEGGTVMFDRIRVQYLNGETDEISVRSRIDDGGKTRIIDLPGNRRVIESISMWYAKRNWHSRPTVRVYGIR